ncbi:GNAT family N-acetyltransferase [Pseudobutyrivibrio sp. LB2011]|uniref:GNAT family N-acetyltransferase n=1 Tax=Pseudobutyrivibrio sp. LB2011 TaxID=1408312 RepID=UPI0005D1346B|nr:GNAT family protein [Pseudobutyrivibrio sp. LB2011]
MNTVLRELKVDDAPLMLEWMHDEEVQKGFQKKMLDMTIDNATSFCESSKIPEELTEGVSVHFAIADSNDEYQGTISLKDISLNNKSAEYAISLRRASWGKGLAKAASKELLDKAFNEYGLHRVYLTVLADNERAIHLYEKCGFKKEGQLRKHIYKDGKYVDWCLYGILAEEFEM